MPKTAVELRQDRAKLIADARLVHADAEKANREITAEERSKAEAMLADADKLREKFEHIEKLEAAEKSVVETRGRQAEANEPGRKSDEIETRTVDHRASEEYRSMYEVYLRGGYQAFGPEEYRALRADDNVAGGYLAAPQQMATEFIKAVDDAVIIRQLATKFTVTSAQSLGAPSLDADPADSDWTSEIQTGSEDSTMAFGKRELHPHPLAKRIKVSNKLIRMVPSAESLVRSRLAFKFGVSEEKAFMTGDGVSKPLGLFTASSKGISTSRDSSTGNTSTAITGEGIIRAKFQLKPQYWRNARWIFPRTAIMQLRLEKAAAGDGNYIWQPGLAAGEPDRILDLPYTISEFAPNTFTTGLYVGILGDFSHYWIADAETLAVQRLVELYAETNQVGFIGRLECDGMPVLEEAFVRVKLG